MGFSPRRHVVAAIDPEVLVLDPMRMTDLGSEDRQEIGVRVALGADPASIVSLIAKRALFQLTLGIALAISVTSVRVIRFAPGTALTRLERWPLILAGASAAVVLIGLIACVAPTLRGLRIRPIEALKAN